MTAHLSDTSPEAEQVLIERLRQLSPGQRLRQVFALNAMVKHFSLAGLKGRYPHASPEELQRRLVALRLEPQTVRRVYGWDPDVEGY